MTLHECIPPFDRGLGEEFAKGERNLKFQLISKPLRIVCSQTLSGSQHGQPLTLCCSLFASFCLFGHCEQTDKP